MTLAKPASLSLRANFSWTFAGNVVYTACQWGIIVLMAKLGSPEIVGQFALGLAVTAPIIMFTNLALRPIQATDAKQEYSFSDYFGFRLVTTLLALAMITIIGFIGYTGETLLVIFLLGLAKGFEALSDVVYGLMQQRERMDRIAQAHMIKGPTSLLAAAAGFALTGSVVGAVLGLAIAWGLLFFLFDLRGAHLLQQPNAHVRPIWEWRRLRRLALLAMPLGFVMMLTSLNTNIPRIFVERFLGEGQLGIFAAMAYLLVAGNTVVGALGQSASPRLAIHYAGREYGDYFRLLGRLLAIGTALGAVGVLVAHFGGEMLLNLFYGPEYAAHADVFVWIMVAAAVAYLSSFLGYAITAARIFKLQLVLSGLPVLMAAGFSSLLIPNGSLSSVATVLILVNLSGFVLSALTLFWIARRTQLRVALDG
jgi:O-antigen/teichoic acid export membrane protein